MGMGVFNKKYIFYKEYSLINTKIEKRTVRNLRNKL